MYEVKLPLESCLSLIGSVQTQKWCRATSQPPAAACRAFSFIWTGLHEWSLHCVAAQHTKHGKQWARFNQLWPGLPSGPSRPVRLSVQPAPVLVSTFHATSNHLDQAWEVKCWGNVSCHWPSMGLVWRVPASWRVWSGGGHQVLLARRTEKEWEEENIIMYKLRARHCELQLFEIVIHAAVRVKCVVSQQNKNNPLVLSATGSKCVIHPLAHRKWKWPGDEVSPLLHLGKWLCPKEGRTHESDYVHNGSWNCEVWLCGW